MNPNRLLQNIRLGWSPLAVIAATTLATIAISVYCLFSGWVIIFQNLFYVPIIIACVFYARKGFAFSVALSFGYLLLIIAFTRDSAVIIQALIRVFIFVGVAGVTTFLSVKRKQIEEELKQHRENLEKLVKERAAELKQAVEEARRLRQQMELIIGAAKAGLGIIDSELNIRYINIEWQKVYGDPKGRKCYEYLMERSDVCPDCGALKALATKQVIVTERVMPKEGNRPIQVTAIPFQDEKGDWLVAEVNADITERKRAEQALRVLSARQEAILDAVHDIIMEVDANKVYTWANQAGLEFFGQDAIGKEAATYFEGEQNTYQTIQPLFNGNEDMLYVESWQRRKDGRKRLLAWWCRVLKNDQGKVTGALSSARDITDWHQAQVTLVESERNFRSLFLNMEEGVALHEIIHDASGKAVDYRILDINPAFERHTGVSAEHARGALAGELYGPGGPPYLEEYSRVANGGKPITFETWFAPLKKQFSISVVSPKPGRFATVFEDITERKHQQEELQSKNAELERFIYTISHDLKAPLVTIKTFLGYLEADRLEADAVRVERDMFFMRSAADTMAKLLDELLEMSRIGRVVNPSVRFTFRDLVEDARNTVAGLLAERGVEVRVGDQPLTLFGDRRRLARIWQNLLENGAKFMGDQAAPLIEVGLEPAGQKTIFFVRDNGVGIDPRHQEKIFDLLERLDSKTEGTGLGLALVKRIVELYGGTITVESKGAGSGSTFRFTLPHAAVSGPKVETP